jgi:hypothetical protein
MNKHNRANFSAWIIAVLCLFLCTGLWAKEEFQARMFPDVGPGGAKKPTKLIISVDSYTSSEEVFQLMNTFNNSGYEQFRAALRAMNKGIVRPTGGRGTRIILHAAQSTPAEKGRNIILVAESESWNLGSTMRLDSRFPYAVIEFSLNEKGKGTGNIYVSAEIKFTSEGTIERGDYRIPPKQLLGVAVMK